MKLPAILRIVLLLWGCPIFSYAQDSLPSQQLLERYLHAVETKTAKQEKSLQKTTSKYLARLKKEEGKLYDALYKVDSLAANALIGKGMQQYDKLEANINDRSKKITQKLSGSYNAALDTMQGVLACLNKLSGGNHIPGGENIDKTLSQVRSFSSTLNQADQLKKLLKEREHQLKSVIQQYKDKLPKNIMGPLKKYQEQAYYYGQEIKEIKETLKDPAKVERKVLALLKKTAFFKKFMKENGQLAQIFGGAGMPNAGQSLAGLQTTQSVRQLIQTRTGNSPAAVQQVRQQVQQGIGELRSLQGRLRSAAASGGNGDEPMPDFTPNHQKTKSFLKRLELSWNMQSTQKRGMYPSVTDMGLSAGYKLNDKSVIGIGFAYKFGLGDNFNKMKWTHEGLSLRAFVDVKWKKNWWISGGYEQNYWQRFNIRGGDNPLRSLQWQQSGLIGLSKKVTVKKKTAKMQVLYDFLRPRTGTGLSGLPVVVRWGYSF